MDLKNDEHDDPGPGDTVAVPMWGLVGVVDAVFRDRTRVTAESGSAAVPSGDLLLVTTHAEERWRGRVRGGGRTDPEDDAALAAAAWLRGLPVEEHGRDADEVRVDPETGAVLLRKDSALVTVLAGDGLNPTLEAAAGEALGD